jgi:hypothetical protein
VRGVACGGRLSLIFAIIAVAGCAEAPPQEGVSTYDGVYRGPSVPFDSNSFLCFPPVGHTLTVTKGIGKLESSAPNVVGTVNSDGTLTMSGYGSAHTPVTVSGKFSTDGFVGVSSWTTLGIDGLCRYNYQFKKLQ